MANGVRAVRATAPDVVEQQAVPDEISERRGKRASDAATTGDEVSALVELARNNNKEAFGQLYRLFHGPVFRLARFYLDGAAEDVVSETFLRAWVALPRYRNRGVPFVAWLYGIARHIVAKERAALRRVEPRAELPDHPSDPHSEDQVALAMAIGRLPRPHRQVIELKFLIGLTNTEVAAALGKSVGAVNTQQWRALRLLRSMMEEG